MYHFVADHPPVPVRLSFRALLPGHVRQYLKQFQIDAIQFMHNFLAKGEFCVYNDESGLGKQASVAVLLDVACGNKKSLIIVQNDDNYVHGWEFHFNVLTNSSVTVIKENKDSTDSPHNIYIAKWSTLRAIDNLSKFDFDYIILDNRGQMLNNTFCTSMLLKHYERKINILISSVDITSDLKLLHNILKLGGRLDPRYASFKVFEEKFKLPDAKELTFRKVDLEDYFLKRERLADYCKNYRLRRYCHQFEQQLPLVEADRYKINLDIYREKQNATNSEGSSVEVASQNRQDERIRDTQELFEEYCRQRRKQQEKEKVKQQQQQEKEKQKQQEQQQQQQKDRELEAICNVDDDEVAFINETPQPVVQGKPINARDNSDEAVVMSPLLLVSDSEDTEDVAQICNDPNDDTDIVDLSTDDENDKNEDTTKKDTAEKQKKTKKVVRRTYINEIERLKQDVATNLKFQNETTPKRRTRHAEETQCANTSKRRGNAITTGRTTPKEAITNNPAIQTKKNPPKENVQKSKESPLNTKTNKDNIKSTDKDSTRENLKATETNKSKTPKSVENECGNADKCPDATPKSLEAHKNKLQKDSGTGDKSTPRVPRSITKIVLDSENPLTPIRTRRNVGNQKNSTTGENKTPINPIPDIVIKKEPEDRTPQTKRSHSKELCTSIQRIKRELNIDHVVFHNKETRSTQRSTRSAGCPSRYASKNALFNNEKNTKPKKIQQEKKSVSNNQITQSKKSKSNDKINDTQLPIVAMTCSQDYEPIQCAQRLSDVVVSENNTQRKTSEFLVPPTPVSLRNSLIPSSLTSSNGFFTESEVIFVPPTTAGYVSSTKTNKKTENVIVLSGSDNESCSSLNLSSTSRRTRALKPRKLQNPPEEASKVPTFSQLLAQHNTRRSAKSPDLFSNCSDLAPLPCSQTPANGDETNAPFEGFKIFGSEVKQLQQHYALTKTQNMSSNGKKSYRDRSCLDILENMFEPPNKNKNKPKVTAASNEALPTTRRATQKPKAQTPILPHHPIEAIAESKAQQDQKNKRSLAPAMIEDEIFEITNNGTFGSVMRLHSNGEISPVHPTQKSSTQHNKITKYFLGGLTQNLTGSQEDSGNNSEAGTPSKKQQQQLTSTQYANLKKSPKQKCSSTQATKLTKWFTKNSPTKLIQTQVSKSNPSPGSIKKSAGKRIVKRRRLDLTMVTDDSD